jgi:ATP-dependent protease ClpP protease subunit
MSKNTKVIFQAPPSAEGETMSDVDEYSAEEIRHLAEADLFAAQAREAKAKARTAELALKDKRRLDALAAASDDRNYVLHLEHVVRDTQPIREKLNAWHRLDKTAPWRIVMNSPGGSVIDGMALFDHIVTHSKRGGGTHEVTIEVRGYAASMGGLILQAADVRVCGPEAFVLIHKVSSSAGGSLDEIEDEVNFLKLINERADRIFVKRSKGKLKLKTLQANQKRKDWWLDSDESLKLGIVDKIG